LPPGGRSDSKVPLGGFRGELYRRAQSSHEEHKGYESLKLKQINS